MSLPIVAIIGRPNVGKSTLFNRLVGKRLALVDDRPGVTRDRREGDAVLLGDEFRIIDTAGFEDEDPASLPGRMRAQTEAAVREADVALFVVDARAGVTPLDEEIARWLRAADADVVLLANKAEGRAGETGIIEAMALGFGDPIPFSAEHGEGLVDLFEALRPYIDRSDVEIEEEDPRRPRRPAQAGDRRAPQCGQVDADQQAARPGPADHRARGGDHARFDRDSLGVARFHWKAPSRAADRYRGDAQEGQGAGQAREAVGGRCAPRDRLRRGGGAAARCDQGARGAGPSHRRQCPPGGPRARDRAQQMGRGRERQRPVQRRQGRARRGPGTGQGRAAAYRFGRDGQGGSTR